MPSDEPPPPPPASPSSALPPPPAAPPGWPDGTVAYAAAAPKRTRGARVALLVGLLALVGVVGSLTVALSGSGAGSGDPHGAVEAFADAVSDEDVVAAVLTMTPTEVGSAHELYDPLIELLVRNGELAGSPLAGVNIEIEGLELETVTLHEDVAKVYLRGGTITLDVVAAEIDPVLRERSPLGEDLHEEIDIAELQTVIDDANAELGSFAAEMTNGATTTGEISGPFLMTVRHEDRWYVSPTYSIAEYAREALGVPMPEFGAWKDEVGPGADSPSAVLESFVGALSALDSEMLASAIESGETLPELEVEGALAPGEFAAFFDYAPVFEQWLTESMGGMGFDDQSSAEANAEIAALLREVEFDITATTDAAERRIDGDRVMVVLDAATFELQGAGEFDGEPVDLDLRIEVTDGLCGAVVGTVRSGASIESVDESGCAEDVLPGVDFDGFFIVTVERDGQWYFSPTETLVQYLRLVIDSELAN
jgi:hypothetical protein